MTEMEELITCFPTQTLRQVVIALGPREVGRIPVLDVRDHWKVIGLLRRGDILRGIATAVARPEEGPGAEPLTGGQLIGFDVRTDDPRTGMVVRELDLPPGVVLVSFLRHGETEVPRGSTVLEPGDHVVAFVDDTAANAFQEWRNRYVGTEDTDLTSR